MDGHAVTDVNEGVNNTFAYALNDGTDENNYAISTVEGILTVTPKSIDETPNLDDGTVTPVLDVNYVDSVVYNGQDQTPTMIVIDRDNKNTLTSADYTVEFQRDGEMTGDLITAGPITIVITGQGNCEGTIIRSFEITRRPVTITADDASKVFGTSDPESFGASVANAVSDGFEFQYSVARETGENAGEYAIIPTGAVEQGDDYTVTYKPGIFTITPAGSNVVENVIAGADGPENERSTTVLGYGCSPRLRSRAPVQYSLMGRPGRRRPPASPTPAPTPCGCAPTQPTTAPPRRFAWP